MSGLRVTKASIRVVTAVLTLAGALFTASLAHAQVVAVVYGEPITALDVEHRARFDALSQGGRAGSRKEVLDELINDKLKLREAKRYGMGASDTEVNDAFGNMASRMRVNTDQLAQMLERSGTSASVVKDRIRSDISWTRLVRGRFSSTLTVGERDILAALGSKQVQDQPAMGYEYTLRPILFVVPEDAPDSARAARRKEAESLRARFNNCDSGLRLARGLRDVVVREKLLRTSSDLPDQQRKILDGMEIGRLTPPEVNKYGIEVFALCEKHATRSDTPQKREAREEVFSKRFQTQAKRYLDDLRRSAMIEYK